MRSLTEPEQYVVLLADMMLMDLPLEALSILQEDSFCSVSRDFSLQLLHSRLRDQPDKGTGYMLSEPTENAVMTFVNVMRHPHQLIPGLKYRDKQPLMLIPKVNLGQFEPRTMV